MHSALRDRARSTSGSVFKATSTNPQVRRRFGKNIANLGPNRVVLAYARRESDGRAGQTVRSGPYGCRNCTPGNALLTRDYPADGASSGTSRVSRTTSATRFIV